MFAGNSGRIWRVCLKSRHSQKGVWQKAAAGIKKGDWRAWRRESVGSAGGDFRPAAGRAFTWKLSCVYPCTYKTVCPEVTICAENNGQEATIQHVQVKGSEMTMTNRTVLTESAMTNSTVVFQMVKKRQKMRVFDGFLHVFASCFAPQLVHLVRDQGSGIRDQRSGVKDQGSKIRDQRSGVGARWGARVASTDCRSGSVAAAGVLLPRGLPYFSADWVNLIAQ